MWLSGNPWSSPSATNAIVGSRLVLPLGIPVVAVPLILPDLHGLERPPVDHGARRVSAGAGPQLAGVQHGGTLSDVQPRFSQT